METTLGEQRIGDQRCEHCKANNTECWVYTGLAMGMVKYASPTYTRCREVAVKGGCSFSKHKQASQTVSASPLRPQQLAPIPQLLLSLGW
jgi:hypothetical protein